MYCYVCGVPGLLVTPLNAFVCWRTGHLAESFKIKWYPTIQRPCIFSHHHYYISLKYKCVRLLVDLCPPPPPKSIHVLFIAGLSLSTACTSHGYTSLWMFGLALVFTPQIDTASITYQEQLRSFWNPLLLTTRGYVLNLCHQLVCMHPFCTV